ncbi:hypothetical protein, variant [Verruconis gallopava]|uniref:Uncharacterized protein n=1 Tax=Verruconis gallopava TaxID=253628 RepID=A0A0D1ZWR7_9PEZI|nr:hypothetical protein, variant [Verruconis gallopava]KIV98459.1 hypothetical protein, variant [Verruconis gallopava]
MDDITVWMTEISDYAVEILKSVNSDPSASAYYNIISDISIYSGKLMLRNGAISEKKIEKTVSGWIAALKKIEEYGELAWKVEDFIYNTQDILKKHTEHIGIPGLLRDTLASLRGVTFQYIGEDLMYHKVRLYYQVLEPN